MKIESQMIKLKSPNFLLNPIGFQIDFFDLQSKNCNAIIYYYFKAYYFIYINTLSNNPTKLDMRA